MLAKGSVRSLLSGVWSFGSPSGEARPSLPRSEAALGSEHPGGVQLWVTVLCWVLVSPYLLSHSASQKQDRGRRYRVGGRLHMGASPRGQEAQSLPLLSKVPT